MRYGKNRHSLAAKIFSFFLLRFLTSSVLYVMNQANDHHEVLIRLLKKRVAGKGFSDEEKALLDTWIASSPFSDELWNNAGSENWIRKQLQEYQAHRLDNIWDKTISNRGHIRKPVLRKLRPSIWWAAATVAVLLTTGYFLLKKTDKVLYNPETVAREITPGKNGAILTLADGRIVSLDTIKDGEIKLRGGAIAKINNGVLSYKGADELHGINKITTARGRQYSVMLSDGSVAWLNSASSISYPLSFNGNIREVTITGEVHFEVNGSPERPFIVNIESGPRVEVLGTSFNINGYENEGVIKATLINGKIRVLPGSGKDAVVLLPGQQAQLRGYQTGEIQLQVQDLSGDDLEAVMAWKNGMFIFNNARLPEIMRQLERWYDIDIHYTGTLNGKTYSGKIYRDAPLPDVLDIFKRMGVQFIQNGRNFTVAN